MVIKDLEIDDRLLALPYSIDVNDEGQIVLTPLQEHLGAIGDHAPDSAGGLPLEGRDQ
jgi:hypothetical protein